MIGAGKFTVDVTNSGKKFSTMAYYFDRDEDGEWSIPSLAYAGFGGVPPHRHFDCDNSGYNFPDDNFLGAETVCIQSDTEGAYDTYDDLPSALYDVAVSKHPNAHAVLGMVEKDAANRFSQLLLVIFWVD